MAKEFKVGEYTYTCMKLNAFEQLNLSRKGAPLFIGMANQQWFNVLHAMPQEDLDLMIAVIMPKVQRKLVTGNWGPIYEGNVKRFIFEDIGGGELLEIIFEVLLDYLPAFITAVGQRVSATAENETPDTQNSMTE